MTRDRYGSADVLVLDDVALPLVGDDEVLIRVHAAGVGPDVWHLMTGLPYFVRLMGFGLRKPKSRGLGWDVAGSVEAVGKDVTQFRQGDEVFGSCRGALAEYACARAENLAPKPASLTLEQAAGVPVSGCTALQGLRDEGGIQPQQRALIIGASGGVGTFAVQLAKVFGAHVTGVCSTTKVDLVRSIGADHVVDYTREDFADGERYDLILDGHQRDVPAGRGCEGPQRCRRGTRARKNRHHRLSGKPVNARRWCRYTATAASGSRVPAGSQRRP